MPVRVALDPQKVDVWDMGGAGYDADQMAEMLREAKKKGYQAVVLRDIRDPGMMGLGGGERATTIAVFDPENIRSVNAKFDPANIGKPDLMGSIDPRLLAPVAAAGGAAMMAQHYGTSPEVEQVYQDYANRRASKRSIWQSLRETVEFGATVGSAVAGGIVGDLSRLGGYINPMQPVEATEAGAERIENAMQYIPRQPNALLESFGRGMNQFSQDIEPIAAPFRQSIPYKAYEALPERAQGIVRIGADLAL
jgi:hypothetical protein